MNDQRYFSFYFKSLLALGLFGQALPVFAADNLDIELTVGVPTAKPAAAVQTALYSYCPEYLNTAENADTVLGDVCNYIVGDTPGTPDQIATMLEELSPKPNSSTSIVVASTTPTRLSPAVGLRLSALRRSARSLKRSAFRSSQFSVLNANDSDSDIPGGLLDQRMSGFLNVNYLGAKQYETDVEIGFDSDIAGLTGGVDYRLGSGSFVGVAPQVSYNTATLTDAKSSLSSTQTALTIYGTHFLLDSLYLEATLNGGVQYLQLNRYVGFSTSSNDYSYTAEGATQSTQYGATFGGGYDFRVWGGINGLITANVMYSNSSIDAYTEKYASDFSLTVEGQGFYSLSSRTSFFVNQVHSSRWGVFVPQLNASWIHEFNDDAETVAASFVNNPAANFSFELQSADPNYFVFGLDVQWVMTMGRSAFISISNVQRLRDKTETSVTSGFRMEF